VANLFKDFSIARKNEKCEGSESQIYFYCVFHWSLIRLLPKNYKCFCVTLIKRDTREKNMPFSLLHLQGPIFWDIAR